MLENRLEISTLTRQRARMKFWQIYNFLAKKESSQKPIGENINIAIWYIRIELFAFVYISFI